MNIYYIEGYPIVDTIHHSGIPGQKWGVRRYQNYDGTLTEEGKLRYYGNTTTEKKGISSITNKIGNGIASVANRAGKRISKTAKLYTKHVKQNIKKNNPWLMDDDELEKVVSRMRMEKNLRDLHKEERASRFINRTLKNAEDITISNMREFGRSFSSTSGKLISERMFKRKNDNEQGKKGKKGNNNGDKGNGQGEGEKGKKQGNGNKQNNK